MHTLLLLASFTIIYLALKREYKKISQTVIWTHRSGLACYILCSSALLLFAVTLNFWVMNLTGCIAFHTHNWDTITSLTIGALLWFSLGVSIIRTLWSQRKVQQIMKLVNPCDEQQALETVKRLACGMGINVPELAVYRSSQPYAATLFWKRPVVLISSWMLETLDEEELEAVLAHEMAHIQRKDNLMVTIGGIMKDILFFLPTMQQTWQNFLVDLETAADDMAVLNTKKPGALASALVQVHKAQPKMEFSYGISYFTPNYYDLEERIERLLANDIQQTAQNSTVRFSTLLFSKEIGLSAGLLVLILCSIYLIPYCHWMAIHPHSLH
jgi:Zn-dependent protease with chaperone function